MLRQQLQIAVIDGCICEVAHCIETAFPIKARYILTIQLLMHVVAVHLSGVRLGEGERISVREMMDDGGLKEDGWIAHCLTLDYPPGIMVHGVILEGFVFSSGEKKKAGLSVFRLFLCQNLLGGSKPLHVI